MQGDVIPDFNEVGALPEGIYKCCLDDILNFLVKRFIGSNTRENIYISYKRFNDEHCRCPLNLKQWINGSFVTSKINPRDIDVVILYDASNIDNDIKSIELLNALNSRHQQIKDHYLTDLYVIPLVPESHPDYERYKRAHKYWKEQWSRHTVCNDTGIREVVGKKGFIELEINPEKEVSK